MLILLVSFRNLKPNKTQRVELARVLKINPSEIEYHRVILSNHVVVAEKEKPQLVLFHENLSPSFRQLNDKIIYAQFVGPTLMRVEKVALVRRGPWK